MSRYPFLACIVLLFSLFDDARAISEFIPLGDFPEGGFFSIASAISDDGTTVVGNGTRISFGAPPAISDAFRWTESTGLVNLQSLPLFDAPLTRTGGVSHDATVIVGVRENQYHHDPLTRSEAFRWTETQGFVGLGYLPGGTGETSGATDVSADGRIIVGSSDSHNGSHEAFYWTELTGMEGLGDLPGGSFHSVASAISDDGQFIVGVSDSAFGLEAFRWSRDGGFIPLGDLPGGVFGSDAVDISDDGRVVVGSSFSTSSEGTQEAFRWTEQSGMRPLGDLAGGGFGSSAFATSSDGSIVLGMSWVFSDDGLDLFRHYKAFVWHERHGIRDLQELLVDEYSLGDALAGWQLFVAQDISDDGLSIVGTGFNPNGDIEAWLVRLNRPIGAPEPASLALLIIGLLAIFSIRRAR